MDPEIIKRLQQSPDFKALAGYLASELAKLDKLPTIPSSFVAIDHQLIGQATHAQAIAHAALTDILATLLQPVDKPTPPNARDFAV